MIEFTMTDTATGKTSELCVRTTNYSMRFSPVNVLGSYEPVEYVDHVIEFEMTGYLSVTQMADLRRSEYSERGFRGAVEPFEPIVKKSVDVRRAELLQQLLDTFREPKNAKD